MGVSASGTIPVQELCHYLFAVGRYAGSVVAFPGRPTKRPEGDPAPLPYLSTKPIRHRGLRRGARGLADHPRIETEGSASHRLALSNTRHMYWSPRQMIAHHTMGGCNLRSGDLFGTGTISAPDPDGFGSILEATQGGAESDPSGVRRRKAFPGGWRRNHSPRSWQTARLRPDRLRRVPGDDFLRPAGRLIMPRELAFSRCGVQV